LEEAARGTLNFALIQFMGTDATAKQKGHAIELISKSTFDKLCLIMVSCLFPSFSSNRSTHLFASQLVMRPLKEATDTVQSDAATIFSVQVAIANLYISWSQMRTKELHPVIVLALNTLRDVSSQNDQFFSDSLLFGYQVAALLFEKLEPSHRRRAFEHFEHLAKIRAGASGDDENLELMIVGCISFFLLPSCSSHPLLVSRFTSSRVTDFSRMCLFFSRKVHTCLDKSILWSG
jgi:hypothetical protein